jgi:hypothetical protein
MPQDNAWGFDDYMDSRQTSVEAYPSQASSTMATVPNSQEGLITIMKNSPPEWLPFVPWMDTPNIESFLERLIQHNAHLTEEWEMKHSEDFIIKAKTNLVENTGQVPHLKKDIQPIKCKYMNKEMGTVNKKEASQKRMMLK